jgi:hypothetical protein
LTSRTIRNGDSHPFPGGMKEIVISCDQMDCGKAVNDDQIREGGGLKEMGWTAIFVERAMRHYCPDHKRI